MLIITIALILVTCLFLAGGYLPHPGRSTPHEMQAIEETQGGEVEDLNYNLRAYFGSVPGASVRGWPSKGGLYTFSARDGVELEFLQVDRFNNTPRSQDPAEEDAHCDRMRKLGARWFRRPEDFYTDETFLGIPSPPQTPVLIVGWPTTGEVWVLKTTKSESIKIGVGKIHSAFNMDERCDAIKQLGGTFYSNPEDCPELDLS